MVKHEITVLGCVYRWQQQFVNAVLGWRFETHLPFPGVVKDPISHTSVPDKWRLNRLNGLGRMHDCDR